MSSKNVFFKLVHPKIDLKHPINLEVEIHARHDGTYQRMTYKLTESNFDVCIDQLIDELKTVRREGKRLFVDSKGKLNT